MEREDGIDEVLQSWFGDVSDEGAVSSETRKRWFVKDEDFDRMLEARFGALVQEAEGGALDDWRATARGALALVLLCDQLPRNIYRKSPRAFGLDRRAQEIALALLDSGAERGLAPFERAFVRMPLMHAEDRAIQERSVTEFDRLRDEAPEALREAMAGFADYARRHARIVERFGRYPHRNQVLGRTSTPEEVAFLKEPGSSF